MNTELMNTRIAAGAGFLDDNFPNWFNHVDLTRLNQDSGNSCVLSQASGLQYLSAKNNLGISTSHSVELAFSCHDNPTNYSEYTEAWKRYIQTRRVEQGQARIATARTEGEANTLTVQVSDIDAFAEIVRKHIAKAIEVGRAGTDGDHTDSGMAFYVLKELGII